MGTLVSIETRDALGRQSVSVRVGPANELVGRSSRARPSVPGGPLEPMLARVRFCRAPRSQGRLPQPCIRDISGFPVRRIVKETDFLSIGYGLHRVTRRLRQVSGSKRGNHAALLPLLLYLAATLTPLVHGLLEKETTACAPCATGSLDRGLLSHAPDEPCSDPRHHHHHDPGHDVDHCTTCRLSRAPAGVTHAPAAPAGTILTGAPLASEPLSLPRLPELLSAPPRAPPLQSA